MSIASARVLAALLLPLCAGCISPTDPFGRHRALEESQRRYTQLVRWGDLEKASQYVDPDLLEEFQEQAALFEDVRISDFEIGNIEYEEPETAIVFVTYRGYSRSTFVEKPIRERQQWVRQGISNASWKVRPEIREIVGALREEAGAP